MEIKDLIEAGEKQKEKKEKQSGKETVNVPLALLEKKEFQCETEKLNNQVEDTPYLNFFFKTKLGMFTGVSGLIGIIFVLMVFISLIRNNESFTIFVGDSFLTHWAISTIIYFSWISLFWVFDNKERKEKRINKFKKQRINPWEITVVACLTILIEALAFWFKYLASEIKVLNIIFYIALILNFCFILIMIVVKLVRLNKKQ